MSKGRMSVLVNNMQRHFHPTEPLLLPDLPAREDTGCAKFLDELKTKAKAGETGLGSEVEYRILNMKPDERLGDILDAADAAESKGIEEFVDKLRSNQSLNDESRVILSSIGPCKTPADTEKAMEKLRLIAKSEAKDVYNEAKNHMASTTFPESLKADIESIKTKIAENERSLNADNIEDALMVISSYNFNTDNLLAKFDKIKNKTNINAIENAEKSLKANRPKADAAKQIDDIIKNLTPGNVNESFASLQKILDPATYSALKASLELKGLKVDTAIPLMKKLIAVIQTITAETPQVKVMRYKLLGSAMAATGFRLSWVDGRAKGWQVPNVHREDIAGFFGQVKDGMNSAFGNDDRYNELVKMLDYENGGWGGFEHIGKFRYDHGETLAKIPEPTRELFNAFMDGILNPIKLGVGMNESVAKKWNVYYPNGGLNAAQTANDRDRKEAGILASLPIYGIDARSIEETAQAMKEWMKLHDGFGSVSATKEVLDSCTRITDAYKTVSEIISELKTKDLSDTSKKNKQIIDTTFSELDNKENFDGIRRIENDAGRCIQLAASKPENSFSGEALDKLKTVLGNLKTKFDTENSEAKKILDDLKNNPYLTNPSKEILSKFDRIVTDNELTNFKKALGEIKIIEQKANEKDDADILKAFGGDVKLMEKLTDCGKANKEKASEDQKQAIENQEKAKEVARQNTEKVHKVYQQANDLACRRYVSDEEVTNLKREIANLKDMPGIDEGTKSVLDGIVRLKGTTQATDSYQDDFREFRRGGGRRQLNPKDPDEMGDWMLRETVNRLVRVREGMQKRFDDLKLPLLSTPAPYLTASDITKIQQWVSQANIEHLKKIADIFDKSSTSSKTIRASEAKEISAKMGEYLKEADGVQKRLKDLEGVMPLARDFDKITSLDELRGISFSKLGAVDKAKFIQKYLALASNDPSSKNYVKFLQGVPRTKSKDGAWIAEGFYIEFLFNSKSLINAVDDTLALAAGSQRDRLAEHTDKLKADQLYLKASTAAVAAMKNLADGKIELVNMPNVTRNFIEYMGQSAKYPVDDNDGKYIPVLPKDYETNPSNDRFILMDENTMALPPDKLEEAFKAVDNKATLDQLEPGKAFGVKKVTVTVGKQSYIVKVGYTTNKEQFKMCVRELEGGDPVKNIGTLPAYPCAKTDLVKTCENVSTNIGTSLQTHQTELKYVMDQLNLIENLASTIRKRLEEMLKLIFSNWR